MKTIKDPDEPMPKLLGPQKIESSFQYIEHPYLVKEGNAIYNALTGEGVIVDNEDDYEELIRRWFLVPQHYDMRTIADAVYQKRLSISRTPNSFLKQTYVIFTTTACNASCSYCFEKDYDILHMTDAIAFKVAEYILASRDKTKNIHIKWFGGEPLCNKDRINLICQKLNESHVSFTSSITTNGFFLPSCTDEELRSWNLNRVQLTLDGIGTMYEKEKGLPQGSYLELKESIKRLSDLGIKIDLRIHYNPSLGIEPCYEIVDEFKDSKNVHMYAKLLYSEATIKYYTDLLGLDQYIVNAGKKSYSFPSLRPVFHCMADNTRIACITPVGELSPCEHYAYGEHMYGSVFSNKKRDDILEKWTEKEKHVNAECSSCPLYPSCKKITSCPAEGKCTEGYRYYKIETIKRALRKKVEEVNGNKLVNP